MNLLVANFCQFKRQQHQKKYFFEIIILPNLDFTIGTNSANSIGEFMSRVISLLVTALNIYEIQS